MQPAPALSTSSDQPTPSPRPPVHDIKLIALDLDGTVLRRDRTISARVSEATREAVAQGCYVTIATGRMPISAREVAHSLNVNTYILCQHGGILANIDTFDVSRRITLEREVACEALTTAQAHPRWHPVVFSLDSIVVTEQRFPSANYSLGNINIVVSPDFCAALGTHAADKILLMLDPSESDQALRVMAECVHGRAQVVQSSSKLVEITSHEATKGTALAQLAMQLGIPRECVMAIGDHDNDVSMLTWAGLGVAMGNASPAARAVADWLAPTIDEDGAAVAIETFVLGHR